MADNYLKTDFVAQALNHIGFDSAEHPDVQVIAHAIVALLRSGSEPSAVEAELLNGPPLIDNMRREISEDDIDQFWAKIRPTGDQRDAFYVCLIRRYTERPDVQARLRTIWETATPYMKAQLFWRILDDPTLPNEWHSRLFTYVLSDWDTFQASSVKFLGPRPEHVAIRALERYGDPSFPASKKWAYLCSAAGAAKEYPGAIRALLSIGAKGHDAFERRVSAELDERLFGKTNS